MRGNIEPWVRLDWPHVPRGIAAAWCGLMLCVACSNATSPSRDGTQPPRPGPSAHTASNVPASSEPSSGSSEGESTAPNTEPSVASYSVDSSPSDDTSASSLGTDTDRSASEPPEPAPIDTDCRFEVITEPSEHIATVAIVTFTTDLGAVDEGYIEFGPDTSYGSNAALDTSAASYRTAILGMAPATEYHYRIVARSGGKRCRSEDQVIVTGPAPEDLPLPSVRVSATGRVAPGYLVTSAQATGASGVGYYIVIYNHLGQPVWWYKSSIGGIVTRAKLSWDGQYIYGRDGNPSARSGGQVVRIAIDGSHEESLTVDTGHHDLAVTPDDGVLFLVGGGKDACGRIQKWSPNDVVRDVYDLRDAFGDTFKPGSDPCHCNSIHYNTGDASITVSCLMQNAYVKLRDSGELLWVLGGNNGQSHFSGDVAWDRQHGHEMLSPDRLLFLNNNGGGDSKSESSLAVELALDLETKTATRVWEYDGGEVTQTLGDVQRLPNGNTLVAYCNAGVLHEVDAEKQLVQSWTFGNGVGYADYRHSLYGAPVRP